MTHEVSLTEIKGKDVFIKFIFSEKATYFLHFIGGTEGKKSKKL